MLSLFFLPSVICGFLRSSCAIGDSRTSVGAAFPLYLVEVEALMKSSRSFLNFSSPGGPANDSLKPKAAIKTSGFSSSSRVSVVVEMRLPRPQFQLVGRIAQVVEHQLKVREAAMKKGLEVRVILHPLGQRVADQDDAIALLQYQPGFLGSQRAVAAEGARNVTAAASSHVGNCNLVGRVIADYASRRTD